MRQKQKSKRKEKRPQPKHECSGRNCPVCEDQWVLNQRRWSGKTGNLKMFRIFHV